MNTNLKIQSLYSHKIAEVCSIASSKGWEEGVKILCEVELSKLDEPNVHLYTAALGYIGELKKSSNSKLKKKIN